MNIKRRRIKVSYDFALQGGAVGEIELGAVLPKNAIIRGKVLPIVVTPFTGGAGATVQFKAKATDGTLVTLTAAAVLATNAADVTEVALSTSAVKVPETSQIVMVVAVNDLTAGKATFIIEYDLV